MKASVAFWVVASILFSTSIITLNKSLSRTYHFHYMNSLTSFHFFTTFVCTEIMCRMGFFERAIDYPWSKRWFISFLGVCSVVFMNFNLQKNSVGFYQLSKLCTIPTLVTFNYFYSDTKTPLMTCLSLGTLLIGVGLFSANDVELNIEGSILAIIAVLSTSAFQYKAGSEQKAFSISGTSLQHATSFHQFVLSLISALAIDLTGPSPIYKHEFQQQEIITIIGTAILAVGVNVSCFALIGKTSAITYQVVGHLKTILILISGFVMFPPTQEVEKGKMIRTYVGIFISLIGIIMYTYLQNQKKPVEEDKIPFIRK